MALKEYKYTGLAPEHHKCHSQAAPSLVLGSSEILIPVQGTGPQ